MAEYLRAVSLLFYLALIVLGHRWKAGAISGTLPYGYYVTAFKTVTVWVVIEHIRLFEQKKSAMRKISSRRVTEMRWYSWSLPSTAECPSVAVWRMTTGTSVVTTTSCRGLTASARVNRAASWKWQQHCGETYPGLVVQLYLDMHKCRTSVKKVRVSHSWSYYRKL